MAQYRSTMCTSDSTDSFSEIVNYRSSIWTQIYISDFQKIQSDV